jgi:hypothetical protein
VGSSVALETARSGRVDMVRNMGRNCYGGICRAISLEGGGMVALCILRGLANPHFLLEIEAIAAARRKLLIGVIRFGTR